MKKIANADIITKWQCYDTFHKGVFEVDVSELIGNGVPICGTCGCDMKHLGNFVNINTPRVIAFVEGGVVHDVMADGPVKLRIIDYDCEGSDDVKKIRLVQENNRLSKYETECHVIKYNLKGEEDLNPFFKQRSIK